MEPETIPLLKCGLLAARASQVDAELGEVSEAEKWRVYTETIEATCELFNNNELNMFDQQSAKLLETDVRQMIEGIGRLKGKPIGIQEVKNYLKESRIEISVALALYDDKEEPDAEKRLHARHRALSNFQGNLEKALKFIQPIVDNSG